MKCTTALGFCSVLLFAPGSSVHAVEAGRVLVAAGEVTVVRAGREERLLPNALVESGDTIRTGPASNAQFRLTDESIIALRPQTEFKLEDYQFQGKEDGSERGIFGLIKGGFRTVTGLIGRVNRANYRVTTPTATVGIRGTHFNLVMCQGECLNADTKPANEGLYGGVIDGRIAVENETGESQFGTGEYFYVASLQSAPQTLVTPPDFLRDRLEGRSRAPQRGGPQTAEVAQVSVSAPAAAQAVAQTAPSATTTLSEFRATETKTQSGTPAVVPAATTTTATSAGDGRMPASGAGLAALSSTSTPTGSNHTVECDDPGYCAGGSGTVTFDASGYKRIDCGSFCFIDRNTAQVAEQGADAGVIVWGKWSSGSLLAGGWYNNLTFGANQGLHYVLGVVPAVMPSSGSVTFNLLGATTPTFSDGIGGGLGTGRLSSGTASVNFATGSITATMGMSFSGTSGTSNYTLAMNSGFFSPGQPSFSGSGTLAFGSGAVNVCPSSGCSTNFLGFFAGPNASHAGLGYDTTATRPSTFYINGVAVFKR